MKAYHSLFGLVISSSVWTAYSLSDGRDAPGSCSVEQPIIKAPRENVWLGLTNAEAREVVNLLHQESTGLNLTRPESARRLVIHSALLEIFTDFCIGSIPQFGQ
jgi:hypothetical protein